MFNARIPLAFILLSATAASALAQPKAAAPKEAVECTGAFGKNATHAGLVRAFGAGNVTFEDVNRAEGEIAKASVVFAKDPARRIEIEWFDGKKRRNPSVITVFGEENRWTGPLGIKNGMTLAEVEKRAGKPFRINGFEFDVAGAIQPAGTKLETLPGGCTFGGHFSIEGGLPPDAKYKRFVGEVEIESSDPDLRALQPRLWIFTLSYPPPGN